MRIRIRTNNIVVMKTLMLVLFLFIAANAGAKTDTLRINGATFVTEIKPAWSEYNRMDTVMRLYRIENGKAKYLLKHFTYQWSADCNNEFIDHGKLEIKNDSLIFHTEYTQKTGMDPIPERRKQIYKVMPDGKIFLIYDRELQRGGEEWIDRMHSND